jgi:hypothetical protein
MHHRDRVRSCDFPIGGLPDFWHPNIHARLRRIAFGIEPQNRAMLCHSVLQQNHINVVVERLFLLKRWFLSFQFARQQRMRARSGSRPIYASEARTITAARPKMKIRTRVSDGEFGSEVL